MADAAPIMSGYLAAAQAFYDAAAETPALGACCVQRNDLELPGLVVPSAMEALTFSCGTTVHPGELADAPTALYIGVGGGLEALQFAWFSRRPASVIAVEPAPRMRQAAEANLIQAASLNPWFDPAFVRVMAGDAFALPVPDESVDLVAQNCLFNIFEPADLRRALAETARVLRPGGRLMMSDPVAERNIPEHLRADDRLRAMCMAGALRFEDYVAEIAAAGFGVIEVRSRKPYRSLERVAFGLDADLALDALDTVSRKTGPYGSVCEAEIFTGRRAVYVGPNDRIESGGVELPRHLPIAVSDRTALRLQTRPEKDVLITPPTWRHAPVGTDVETLA